MINQQQQDVLRVDRATGRRYMRHDLERAFAAVKPRPWAKYIKAIIAAGDREVTREAILFFLGEEPVFTRGMPGKLLVRTERKL
jgi:hypothetical protein